MDSRGTLYGLPVLPRDAAKIVAATMTRQRRVLLFGAMGTGKSTLAAQLADALAAAGRCCSCVSADPGSPAFGVPGSVSVATRRNHDWELIDYAALCSLDAGRFRLPLTSAVRQLSQQLPPGMTLIDAPGVVRGIAGRELLHGLCEAASVDLILVLTAPDRPPRLLQELNAMTAQVYMLHAATEARRPGKRLRARQRTAQWDGFLAHASEQTLELAELNVSGTPPLPAEESAWTGKQIALLQAGRTLAMGEAKHVDGGVLVARVNAEVDQADTLLIRDAVRTANGHIETAKPYAAERIDYLPPGDVLPAVDAHAGPRVVGRVGPVDVALVNGVFGDPLLHVRLRHQRRSLLFDLGAGDRLPARIAHQVTDVFISHAHMDHIGGFLWLLRSRIGEYPVCRLYGPPGLARHIAGFLQAILWDRVDRNAPGFEVIELHSDDLQSFHLKAGDAIPQSGAVRPLVNDVLLGEAGFCVRGISLDHQGTAVIAYAFEAKPQLNIRKDRLKASQLEPGPWLNTLKQHIYANNQSATLSLPDGSQANAAALADALLQITPGKRLVYATDLGDTLANRKKLVRLARHAHTFFCECSYMEADVDYAIQNGHLTSRACGEIATQAGVTRLVPFHFSRRYQHRAEQLYDELTEYCAHVCLPRSMTVFDTTVTSGDIELADSDE